MERLRLTQSADCLLSTLPTHTVDKGKSMQMKLWVEGFNEHKNSRKTDENTAWTTSNLKISKKFPRNTRVESLNHIFFWDIIINDIKGTFRVRKQRFRYMKILHDHAYHSHLMWEKEKSFYGLETGNTKKKLLHGQRLTKYRCCIIYFFYQLLRDPFSWLHVFVLFVNIFANV